MAHFYCWETASFTVRPIDKNGDVVPIADYTDIIVSIVQQGKVEKHYHADELEIDVETSSVKVDLQQEDTGEFRPGIPAKIQLNVLFDDAERDTTAQGTLDVLENLYKRVME